MKTVGSNRGVHRPHWTPILFVLLMAFALRAYRLDWHPLWIDEVATLLRVDYLFGRISSFPTAFAWLPQPRHAVQTLIISPFTVVLPDIWALRVPSILLSTLAVAVSYRVGRILDGRALTGVIAASLLAVTWHHILYAQHGKQYQWILLLALCVMWLALYWMRALQVSGWKVWALPAISVLLVSLHIINVLWVGVWAAFILWSLWQRQPPIHRQIWSAWGTMVIGSMGAAAWIVYRELTRPELPTLSWAEPPRLLDVLEALILSGGGSPQTPPMWVAYLLIATLIAMIGLVWLTREAYHSEVVILLMAMFTPPIALLITSHVVIPMWAPRYVLPSLTMPIFLFGLAFRSHHYTIHTYLGWVLTAVAMLISIQGMLNYHNGTLRPYNPHIEVYAELVPRLEAHDVVVGSQIVSLYYQTETSLTYHSIPKTTTAQARLSQQIQHADRIWITISRSEFTSNQAVIETILPEHSPAQTYRTNGFVIALYTKP